MMIMIQGFEMSTSRFCAFLLLLEVLLMWQHKFKIHQKRHQSGNS